MLMLHVYFKCLVLYML